MKIKKSFKKIGKFFISTVMIFTTVVSADPYITTVYAEENNDIYTAFLETSDNGNLSFKDTEEMYLELHENDPYTLISKADNGYVLDALEISNADSEEIILSDSDSKEKLDLSDNEIQLEMENVNIKIKAYYTKETSLPVEAEDKIETENEDNCLDSLTAQYIKDNIDTQYAKAEKTVFSNMLLVKNTLVEKEELNENETIDSLFSREDVEEVFIATIPSDVALYNTDDDSDYYVGYADTMHNDKTAQIIDHIFAKNNNDGEVVDNCHYDNETGLVYVPKSLFVENDEEIVENIQIQFLQAVSQEVENMTSKIEYTTTEDDEIQTGTGKVDAFSFETKVKTETGLSKSEMTVSVNGVPVANEDYSYSKNTGTVTIPVSSAGVQSVSVDIEEKSTVSKIADKIFNIKDVEAISINSMGCAGTIDLPSGVGVGWAGDVPLYKGYASSWGSATLPAYGYGSSESELVNLIYSGGTLNYSKLSSQTTLMYLGICLYGHYSDSAGTVPSFWNWSGDNISGATANDMFLRMQCTHVSNPAGNGKEWAVENIRVRVLAIQGDEIIIGFLTKQVNTQSGATIAKFKIRQKKGTVELTKTSANVELSNNNPNYSLEGAYYGIWKDAACTQGTGLSFTTDKNGYAKLNGELDAGTYYVREITAPKGYCLNTKVYPVTIKANETSKLTVSDEPGNDPVAIQITKLSKSTGESVSQGAASLEGAQFTIKYFAVDTDKDWTVDTLPDPTRTWVIQTKWNNYISGYIAQLSENHKVSGDEFYIVDGLVTLPAGVITIEETKAPEGYLLNNKTIKSTSSNAIVENGIYLTKIITDDSDTGASVVAGNYFEASDEVVYGKIKVTKKSSKTGEVVTNRETVFGIYAAEDMYIDDTFYAANERVSQIKTVNGVATSDDLPYGKYIVREDDAPNGFEITLDQKTVEIKNDGDVKEVTFSNNEKTGSLTLSKSMTNNRADFTGDAFLEGNTYTLYALEDIIDPSTGKVIYSKDEAISKKKMGNGTYGDDVSKVTDKNGKCTWSNLPLGKYYAKETGTNVSLVLNKNKVVFPELTEKTPDLAETITGSAKTTDKVKEFKFSFYKQSVGSNNEKYDGLNGAVFQVKLKSDVDKYGWDKAPVQDEVTTETKDVKPGYAETKYLPYSTYIVKEIKAPDGYRLLLDPFTVSFDDVDGEFTLFVNDEQINEDNELYSLSYDETDEIYTVNMTVFNQRYSLLPDTGSSMTLFIMGSGIVLCLFIILRNRKNQFKGNKNMKSKKMRKIAVCLLSLCTVGSMTAAFNTDTLSYAGIVTKVNAAERGTITIKANVGDDGNVQSLAGKKFKIYKLFDAENADGMESINYTINPKYEEVLKEATNKDTEYAVIDYIQSLNNNLVVNDVSQAQENESRYSQFRYFVESLRNLIVEKGLEDTMTVTVPSDVTDNYKIDVAYGYYIIDEVTSVNTTHSAASLCLVNTVNQNITISIKSDYPVIQKQIREDDNRDEIGTDGWNDVADYEIGQTVPYRHLTYVPNINGYSKYYFAMHDRMDEELTFNEKSVVVKIGSHTLEKDVDYKVVTTGIPEDETFQIQITDLKATVKKYFYADVKDEPETEKDYGQKIVVEYNATLNDKAQSDTGRPGFENDVKLEFSNNPDSDGTGSTGETPWDTVVAFTFRMDGVKVNDQDPEVKLEGAKFRLYSDEECTQEVYVKKGQENGSYVVINRDTSGSTAPADAVEMVSDSQGIFNIIGLDSQTYYLKETKAPDGYRLLKDPIILNIKATYGENNRNRYIKGDGATDKTLQKLEASAHFKEFYTGEYSEYDNNLNTDVETGTVDLKVVNQVGSKLPATGSVMTFALVATGSSLCIYVFVKRRKQENKE